MCVCLSVGVTACRCVCACIFVRTVEVCVCMRVRVPVSGAEQDLPSGAENSHSHSLSVMSDSYWGLNLSFLPPPFPFSQIPPPSLLLIAPSLYLTSPLLPLPISHSSLNSSLAFSSPPFPYFPRLSHSEGCNRIEPRLKYICNNKAFNQLPFYSIALSFSLCLFLSLSLSLPTIHPQLSLRAC